MKSRDLAPLVRLTGVACEAVEARLVGLRRDEADLRRQIAALEEARQTRAAEARATDITLRAGVDLRWETWIDRRSSALALELARLLARIEMARDELRTAFGRRSAIEDLAKQARSQAEAARLKKEDRGW